MQKRPSNVTTFRLDAELRDLLGAAAARQNVTVTEVLQTLVREAFKPSTPNAFEQTAGIPARILAVERAFGLNVIDSATSLKGFGIESVRDLASPAKLRGLGDAALETFAAWYELQPEWLTTGMGEPLKSTHPVFDPALFLGRLKALASEAKLRGVVFVWSHYPPDTAPNSQVILALAKAHPVAALGAHTVYESWAPVVAQDHAAVLDPLARACTAGLEDEVERRCLGMTLARLTFEDLARGRSLFPVALQAPVATWPLAAAPR